MRRFQLLIAAIAFCVAATSARAGDADPAALFPADTFFYAEADGAALLEGARQLDVARLLNDPKHRAFLAPLFRTLGVEGKEPAAALLARLAPEKYLAGKAAVGICGFTIEIDVGGKTHRFEISPEKPIDAALVFALTGGGLADALDGWAGADAPDIRINGDAIAVVEPGPALVELADRLIANLPAYVARSQVRIGDRDVTRFAIADPTLGGVLGAVDVFLERSGPRWILTTRRERMAAALGAGPRAPLATSARFTSVRDRMTAGRRVFFAFADVAQAFRMFRAFVPPIVAEMAQTQGIASVRGAGAGISLVEGGVRESFGIVLDGEPKGFWKLLDAFPGGLRSIEISPPGAVGAFAVKFDAALFFQRTAEYLGKVAPGNEKLLERLMDDEFRRETGFELMREIVPALGDEMGLVLFPPPDVGLMPIPGWVFGLEVRDADAFKALLKRAEAAAKEDGIPFRAEPTEIAEGISGYQIFAPLPVAAPPVFVLHKGHLFGASDKKRLLEVIREWGKEGAKSLAKDGAVFQHVMRGLGGAEDRIALAYVDFRAILPVVAKWTISLWSDDVVDKSAVPDFARMAAGVSGVAVGIRRNAHGVYLDSFSPTGVILPSVAWLVVAEIERDRQRAAQRRRAIVRRGGVVKVPQRQPDAPYEGFRGVGSDGGGVIVYGMFEESPAKAAGFAVNDRIVQYNAAPIRTLEDLKAARTKCKAGEEVTLVVLRDKKKHEVKFRLARYDTFYK